MAPALYPSVSFSLTPDDVVREVKHLPSAPKVLPRLKRLLADGNSAIDEIVALVRFDPGLAARVLQSGNSAYFSQGARCTTVEEAVRRVGYDRIYELVSYAVASQVLVRPLEVYGIEADELWKLSVACALGAEAIAKRTGRDPRAAYTLGLLHRVGMVALDEWALREGRTLAFLSAGFPREATADERAALGFTQADVGAALLKHWEFPASTTEPVRWQYAPGAAATHVSMACLLHAAKWTGAVACAPEGSRRPPLPAAAQLQPLGLSPFALEAAAIEVARQLGEISSLLAGSACASQRHRFPSAAWA